MNSTKLLELKQIRVTEIRQSTLSLLLKSKNPLSHQEIIGHKSMNSFNRVTIYRTLDTFVESKLIHKALGPDGTWRFCANSNHNDTQCSGNHPHFFCTRCKKMICLPESQLPWVEAPKGAEIYGKQLLVYGQCPKCTQKRNKK